MPDKLSKNTKLTQRQEKFIRKLIEGKSQRSAYREAFGAKKMKDKSVDEKASTLFKETKIQSRYKELLKQVDEKAIITRVELLKKLTDSLDMALGKIETIMMDEKIKNSNLNVISSIANTIIKMQGWDKQDTGETKEDKIDKYFSKLEEALK